MRQMKGNWPQKQRGLGKWGWLFVVTIVGGVLTMGLRLGPHYIDYQIVQGVADRLPTADVHKKMSRAQINEHFKKQFRIESFRVPVKDVIKIERDRERTVLNIGYEIREHLFYNIDVVLVFGEQRIYQ